MSERSALYFALSRRGGGAVQRFGQDCHLRLRAGHVSRVDGLVDTGDDDCGVTGELAGRVDRVFVPGASRQSLGREQVVFGV